MNIDTTKKNSFYEENRNRYNLIEDIKSELVGMSTLVRIQRYVGSIFVEVGCFIMDRFYYTI